MPRPSCAGGGGEHSGSRGPRRIGGSMGPSRGRVIFAASPHGWRVEGALAREDWRAPPGPGPGAGRGGGGGGAAGGRAVGGGGGRGRGARAPGGGAPAGGGAGRPPPRGPPPPPASRA